jgi:hypothetical protein
MFQSAPNEEGKYNLIRRFNREQWWLVAKISGGAAPEKL